MCIRKDQSMKGRVEESKEEWKKRMNLEGLGEGRRKDIGSAEWRVWQEGRNKRSTEGSGGKKRQHQEKIKDEKEKK